MLDNKSQTPIEVSFDSKVWNLPNWKNTNYITDPSYGGMTTME